MADKLAKGRHVSVRGEKHWNAKLTWEKVAWIRIGAVFGGSQGFLAECCNVSRTTVRDILNGEAWKVTP